MESIKKVLIIGYANGYFRREYVRNVRNENIIYDILSFEKCNEENRNLYGDVYECISDKKRYIKIISVYFKFIFWILKSKKYDAIHIHFAKPIESRYAFFLKLKCKKLVSSIYGSDLYRMSDKRRKQLTKLYSYSDSITVATTQVKDDFNRTYNGKFKDKVVIVPFGNTMYDEIDLLSDDIKLKREFGIPENSFVITVGYNATKEQHHIDIIEQIKKIEQYIPSNYYLLIPLGYGDEECKKQVCNYFRNSGMKGACFCEYYSIEDAAKLRVISDVMIQLQDTDVLSNSMMEYIYANNVVITGAWLPYADIKDYIITVETVDELQECLKVILGDYNQYKEELIRKKNKEFIKRRYTWKVVKEKWLSLYD